MTARRVRPVQITTGRHPFEVAVLAAAALCGAALIATGVSPRSVAAAMPGLVQTLWQLGLLGGGVIGLVGAFWPGKLAAQLGAEAVGVIFLGGATTMYTIALFAVSGSQALAAGAFVGAVAVASWTRVAQIADDLRRVAAASASGNTADVTLLVERQPR
jgi:hypothetical protein